MSASAYFYTEAVFLIKEWYETINKNTDPPGKNANEFSDDKRLASKLLEWYDRNRRDLPWRDRNNAYYTWVSEIMLQQTRTAAAEPYFKRFIKELPDVQALADCPEDRLLKLWEGLGYYSRVRNLQTAARQVCSLYGGKLPSDFDTLLTLKGVGRYTAGAISSIAYGKRTPAVDGNVLRIFARLQECHEDIMKQSVRISVEKKVLSVMSGDRPGDFNQALMDLGAMICLPGKAARCGECPLREECLAFAQGTVEMLPVKTAPKERRIENRTVFLIQQGSRTLIRKRPEKGLLAGLYELPGTEGWIDSGDALAYVRNMGLDPLFIEPLPEARHVFSHVEWRMKAYRIRVSSLGGYDNKEKYSYFSRSEAKEELAIPSAFSAYVKYFKED